jgi:hypothetical protein
MDVLGALFGDKPRLGEDSKKIMDPVTTMQIYKGAVPFVLIQLFMVGVLIAFPGLVTGNLDKAVKYDLDKVGEQMREGLQPEGAGAGTGGGAGGYGSDAGYGAEETPNAAPEAPAASGAAAPGAPATPEPPAPSTDDDPMKAMQEALKPKQ